MRLINADKIYPDVRTQHGALAISQGQLAYAETVNAIPIPEDATNGDAIKAMFPNMEITRIQANCVVIQIYEPFYINCAFNLNWWNAKYKGVE